MAATATQTEGTKRPIISVNRAAAVAKKTAIQNPNVQEQVTKQPFQFANEDDWLNAIEESFSLSRQSLLLELGMGLVFYASKSDGVDFNDKKQVSALKNSLREIYVKAGYKAESKRGENSKDFSTVWRRCDASFGLFLHIGGQETVRDWCAEERPRNQIKFIANQLEQFNFTGINSVLEQVGKPVTKKKAKGDAQPEGKETPAPTLSAEAAQIPGHAGTDGVKADWKQQQGDDVGTQPQQGITAGAAATTEQDADAAAMKAMDKHYSAPSGTQNRRAVDKLPPGRILKTDNLVVAIPFNVSYGEVLQMAQALVDFAQQQLSPAGNVAPAMH
jgi:hypothetical protein